MTVTDNARNAHFISFLFLECDKKTKYGTFQTDAAVPEIQFIFFYLALLILYMDWPWNTNINEYIQPSVNL